MSSSISRYIWRSLWLLAVLLTLIGCGLPDYAQIDPPTKITGAAITDTVVGFTTPVDDANVTGYAVYYKIYQDFEELYTDDLDAFSNLGDGLLPGNTLPIQKGFVRAGGTDQGRKLPSANGFNIPHINPDEDVYLNFDPTGAPSSNERAEPEVIRLDPDTDPDPIVGVPMNITLARGFIDIEDSSSDPQLRDFVDDWRVGANESTDYFDGDLRRPPPSSQPGTSSAVWTGAPIFTSGSLPSNLQVAVVVYSVGIDTSGGGLTFLASEPVHLGRINYDAIQAAVR